MRQDLNSKAQPADNPENYIPTDPKTGRTLEVEHVQVKENAVRLILSDPSNKNALRSIKYLPQFPSFPGRLSSLEALDPDTGKRWTVIQGSRTEVARALSALANAETRIERETLMADNRRLANVRTALSVGLVALGLVTAGGGGFTAGWIMKSNQAVTAAMDSSTANKSAKNTGVVSGSNKQPSQDSAATQRSGGSDKQTTSNATRKQAGQQSQAGQLPDDVPFPGRPAPQTSDAEEDTVPMQKRAEFAAEAQDIANKLARINGTFVELRDSSVETSEKLGQIPEPGSGANQTAATSKPSDLPKRIEQPIPAGNLDGVDDVRAFGLNKKS